MLQTKWKKAAVVLALVGFTIGTLLDGAHTHTNKIQYTTPVFWLFAWWTPFIFACGSLTTGLSRPLAEKILRLSACRPSMKNVISANAIFYLAYVLSGYLPLTAIGITVVLVLLWIVLWLLCDRTFLGVALSLITATWGPSLEMGLSKLGVFHYVEPNFFSVTSWLPALYAIAAISSGQLGKALVQGIED